VAICLSTVGIAITFQKITTYFSIFGGTFGISIAIIFPLLCARKLLKFDTTFQKALVVFVIFMSSICLFGSITKAAS
jgi:amino acid permease